MIKIEKVSSPKCKKCDSYYIIITKKNIECDNCDQITAKTSDLAKEKNNKLTSNYGEINEII